MFSIARKAKATENIAPKKLKIEADSDDDEEVIQVKNKRKRSAIIDSDSDSDYVNDENESDNSQSMTEEKPKSSKKSNGNSMVQKKPKLDSNGKKMSLEDKLKGKNDESHSLSDVMEIDNADIMDVPVVWRHQKLDFLKPDQIRDAQNHRPNHADYDPCTLYVPTKYLDTLTPVSFSIEISSNTKMTIGNLT